ncbi:unnamed protein product [Effrenium voratum]|nr:unnamed protein product [Effrenium voratum]
MGVLEADAFALLARKAVGSNLAPLEADWVKKVYYEEDGRGREALLVDYQRFSSGNNTWVLEAYSKINGNFLAPLLGLNGRNAFHLRSLWHCFQLLLAEEAHRDEPYKYWIFARLDWHWLYLPPSLSLFEQVDPAKIWIPDGADWDGINDRFALVPRHLGERYFGRWKPILNGSYVPMLASAHAGQLDPRIERGPEWSLLATLSRIPVARFAAIGAVLCPKNSRRGRHGRCTRRDRESDLSFKYSAEVSEASANAARLLKGWTWQPGPAPLLEPPCFKDPEDGLACCSRTTGVSGSAPCWNDVYDFGRCCHAEQTGLWVLPTPPIASEMLASGSSLCWHIVEAVQRCLPRSQLEQLAQLEPEQSKNR